MSISNTPLFFKDDSDNKDHELILDYFLGWTLRSAQKASEFTEELKSIQASRSINDIINFRQISPDRIKLISKTASQFYTEYFANGAALLKKELEEIEGEEKLF